SGEFEVVGEERVGLVRFVARPSPKIALDDSARLVLCARHSGETAPLQSIYNSREIERLPRALERRKEIASMNSVRFSALLALAWSLVAMPVFADETSERAASELLEKRMKTQRPEDLILLKSVQGKDIVVVRGSMDHIEQVLAPARIRHTVINPEDVGN